MNPLELLETEENYLVLGDTHGHTSWWCNTVLPQMKKAGLKVVIQCGDFGFWPGNAGKKYLNALSKYAEINDVYIFWLDGNHDWHDVLDHNRCYESDVPVKIQTRIYYLPRGFIWTVNSHKMMSLGGAYSVDKFESLKRMQAGKGTCWWPQEEITEQDVKRAIGRLDGQTLNVMFTHDVVWGYKVPGVHASWKEDYPESVPNREKLYRVFERAKPDLLFHGHFHEAYQKQFLGCRFIGLNCNPLPYDKPGFKRQGQAVVLNTKTLSYLLFL